MGGAMAFLLWLLCLLLAAGGLWLQPLLWSPTYASLSLGGYLVVTGITLIFLAAAVIPAVLVISHPRRRDDRCDTL
jgi:hypothetical protein